MKSLSLLTMVGEVLTALSVRKFLFISLSLLAFAGFCFAQGVTGTILGTIDDSSGAGVPNASVTVTNQDTNQSLKVPTGDQGNYIASHLPPGRYRVTAKASGFRDAVSDGNIVAVNQHASGFQHASGHNDRDCRGHGSCSLG